MSISRLSSLKGFILELGGVLKGFLGEASEGCLRPAWQLFGRLLGGLFGVGGCFECLGMGSKLVLPNFVACHSRSSKLLKWETRRSKGSRAVYRDNDIPPAFLWSRLFHIGKYEYSA